MACNSVPVWIRVCSHFVTRRKLRESQRCCLWLCGAAKQLPAADCLQTSFVRWEKYAPSLSHFSPQPWDFYYCRLNVLSLIHPTSHLCFPRANINLFAKLSVLFFLISLPTLEGVPLPPSCGILNLWFCGCWCSGYSVVHPQYSVNIKSLFMERALTRMSGGANSRPSTDTHCAYSRQDTQPLWTSVAHLQNEGLA